MSAQSQTASPAPAKIPEPPAQRRLVGLVLFEASRFNHSDSVMTRNVGGVGSVMTRNVGGVGGGDTRIVPARLGSDGDWSPCVDKERPDGFGFEQYRGAGKERRLQRGFVTLAAVKELVYAE